MHCLDLRKRLYQNDRVAFFYFSRTKQSALIYNPFRSTRTEWHVFYTILSELPAKRRIRTGRLLARTVNRNGKWLNPMYNE